MLKNKLSALNIDRILIIEPGLKKTCGHPIEYATALNQYLHSIGVECHIVSHIQIDKITKAEFHTLHPIISQGCFEFQNSPNQIYENLKNLDSLVELCKHDLVIWTSCFTQELIGSTDFFQSLPNHKCPRVAFNFHQLYPPRQLFGQLSSYSKEAYQQYWLHHIQQTFEKLNIDRKRLSFWTSPSVPLSHIYENISKHLFQPLPFLFANRLILTQIKDSQNTITLGFLGDGRKEKGLLLLLEAIERDFVSESEIKFTIQNLDARGYSDSEAQRLNHLLHKVRNTPHIMFFEQPLTGSEFNKLVSSCDALILPYDPTEYSVRSSMLFAQSAINQKPVIVPSGTWMALEVVNKYASGVIYTHNSFNFTENITSLSEAIQELKQNFVYFKEQANQRSRFYQNWHTAENYLTKIIDFYNHM